MFYWFIKLLFWPAARFYFRMGVRGRENIPESGAALIAANHFSYLDPPCLGSASPRKVHFIIKRGVYEKFMMRWFYRWMEAVPVRESQADLEAIRISLEILGKGEVIGIFPQGQRISAEEEIKWLNGASFMAAKAGCPIIPCAIMGTEKALGLKKFFPRPVKISVVFGKPLAFAEVKAGQIRKEDIKSLTDSVFEKIMELSKNREHDPKGALQ